ncbi:hypothetical protein C2E23DRAFT_531132 [Lenzites betulinus]|nr:hypothetical protein C2E23DRAFT_531132 [Lenzites betulinus]
MFGDERVRRDDALPPTASRGTPHDIHTLRDWPAKMRSGADPRSRLRLLERSLFIKHGGSAFAREGGAENGRGQSAARGGLESNRRRALGVSGRSLRGGSGPGRLVHSGSTRPGDHARKHEALSARPLDETSTTFRGA